MSVEATQTVEYLLWKLAKFGGVEGRRMFKAEKAPSSS